MIAQAERAALTQGRSVGGRLLTGAAAVAMVAVLAIGAATALPTVRPNAAPPSRPTVNLQGQGLLSPVALAVPASSAASAHDDADARRFTGRIGSNLTASLEAAGVPERSGREYVMVLSRAIQLADGLSVDDRFDLVVERTPDGTFGRLLYVGLDRVARADVSLLKWTDGRHIIWVNGDGVGGETRDSLGRPVAGRVTSGFGTRFHPILGYARMHKGVDLAAAYGSPIVAAADGRVVTAGWHGGYGREVAIAHADGLKTVYGHMSRIAIAAGEWVRRGQVIGYVGSSGLSTGPHVHFEVLRNGQAINPLSAKLADGPAQLQGQQLEAFRGELRKLLILPGSV